MQTELITYDLKDRGREYRGQDREYSKQGNLKRLIDAINSGATQERVKFRDMHGFYGHDVRKIFGLIPPECAIHDGKKICLEPDLVTTHLKAYKDGKVEHKAEFTDSDGGEKAWRLYQKKLGGFSSAIDEKSPEFFGFDYVLEPNYAKNRGHTVFDGVNESEILAINESFREHFEATLDKVSHFLGSQYSRSQSEFALTFDRINQLEKELDQARKKLKVQERIELEQQQIDHDALARFDNAERFLDADIALTEADKESDFKPVARPVENHLRHAVFDHLRRTRG